MALPIRRSLPSFSEITSPSAGLPKTFRTSLEKTQSCPCKIRARGLTTIPAIVVVGGEMSLMRSSRPSDLSRLTSHQSQLLMQTQLQSSIDLPGIQKLRSGKVREVFDLGETLLFVVTDRISAFDVILPSPIPCKGAVLNQISAFWFKRFDDIQNHFVTATFDEFPKELQPFREQLAGRSMIVKKTQPFPVECVVRGYLAGSGWKEYQESQSVCGIKLPAGLKLASQLPEPIFTPSTKAEQGHDENIDMKQCAQILGDEIANRVETLSLEIYSRGREYVAQKGIIVADTKFE